MTLQQAELAAVAVAAAAKAEIESSYVLAIKNPRNEDDSRTRILNVCRNLKFAEGAKYSKPQGSKKNDRTGQWEKNYVVGPSIRFAEEAIRLWKNIKVIHTTIYDDQAKRVVKVTVIDLESNISYSKDITIEKIVERKDTKGRTVVGERINSYGEKISIVLATEDEIQNKESALASKTIRNNSLRVIPDYIITEAMEIVDGVVKARVDADPAAAKRMVLDNFAKLNILPTHIEQYLGHPLDVINTSEIVELKQLFTTIHEGNATWAGKRLTYKDLIQ